MSFTVFCLDIYPSVRLPGIKCNLTFSRFPGFNVVLKRSNSNNCLISMGHASTRNPIFSVFLLYYMHIVLLFPRMLRELDRINMKDFMGEREQVVYTTSRCSYYFVSSSI